MQTNTQSKLKIGAKAHYAFGPNYVLAGHVTALHKDGFLTFDAGSRGSFNLAAKDPDLKLVEA